MDGSVGAQALGDLETHRPTNERLMLAEEEIVGVRTIDAANLVNVTKPLCDEQNGLGPVPLQQRVDRDGRAVKEQICVLRFDFRDRHRVFDAADELSVRRQRLAEVQFPGVFVEGCEIRKSATDVDGNSERSCVVSRRLCRHGRYPV